MSIILIIFNHAWLSWCSNDISTVLDKYIPVKKEGDDDQEDLGGRSFLNILSVLAGRNSLGLARWFQSSSSWKPCLDMTIMTIMTVMTIFHFLSSGLARVVQGGSTSDSDESDQVKILIWWILISVWYLCSNVFLGLLATLQTQTVPSKTTTPWYNWARSGEI